MLVIALERRVRFFLHDSWSLGEGSRLPNHRDAGYGEVVSKQKGPDHPTGASVSVDDALGTLEVLTQPIHVGPNSVEASKLLVRVVSSIEAIRARDNQGRSTL